MKPKKKSSKIKKPKVSSLKKKAWRVFSLWIRKRDPKCVLCGGNNDHAGHFISRRFQGTLFDERNVHSQDIRCNIFLKGNLIEYYEFMKRKYGQEVIDELRKESKKIKRWKPEELQEIIRKYSG